MRQNGMPSHELRCQLSPLSETALSAAAQIEWSAVELCGLRELVAGRKWRVDFVQFVGERTARLFVDIVEMAHKWEITRLAADNWPQEVQRGMTVSQLAEIEARLLRDHQLSVLGRRHEVPDWVSTGARTLIVEDVLVAQSARGKPMFLSVEYGAGIGALVMARDYADLEVEGVSLEYVRTL